jgi:hypothetical protein
MRDRRELALKLLCGAAGLLLLYRVVLVIAHINPLYHVAIPKLPTLSDAASATNAAATTLASAKPAAVTTAQGAGNSASNTVAHSNSTVARVSSREQTVTNAAAHSTNLLALGTNSPARLTNAIARADGTNVTTQAEPTNKLAGMPSGFPPGRGRMPGGFPGMPGMPGMQSAGPALPPEIQARLDRVVDSEILAPVMRPMPMALLGIAGADVFLRAPNGQTGLVKEGDELGGVKVLRVGLNRVLVEQQGERKELTIFSGFGSESLQSTQKDGPK